jgi:hypothetical protein
VKTKTFTIPENVRQYLVDTNQKTITFQYTDPIHAMVSMLHFNPLAADEENLCFTYEKSRYYDDFCNGDRMKRIQVSSTGYFRVSVESTCSMHACHLFRGVGGYGVTVFRRFRNGGLEGSIHAKAGEGSSKTSFESLVIAPRAVVVPLHCV